MFVLFLLPLHIKDPLIKQHLEIGKELDGLYLMDYISDLANSSIPPFQSNNTTNFSFSCQISTLKLWHCRLSHMYFDDMKHIAVISSCKSKPSSFCQICHQAKQHHISFPLSNSSTSHIFGMIYVDLWGPYATSIYNGYRYFLTIGDDYSRATWTHLLDSKSNAFSILKSFICFIKTQCQATVQVIRFDNGQEFFNNFATAFYDSYDIIHQTSCTWTP